MYSRPKPIENRISILEQRVERLISELRLVSLDLQDIRRLTLPHQQHDEPKQSSLTIPSSKSEAEPTEEDTPAGRMANVHPPEACEGRGCWVHHPSDHHMKDWPVIWRSDRGIAERQCPHGIGHDDPDDLAYRASVDKDADGIHSCDGCCAAPTVEERAKEAGEPIQ